MDLRQQFVRGVVWSVIQSWGQQGITFIVFLLLARLLQPEAFGLVSLAGVFLAFVQIFNNQGFGSAIVQRQEVEPEHLDTAFWSNLGVGLLLTVFCFVFAGLGANFFNQPELTPIIRWLSLSFLISASNQVQSAVLSRRFNFKSLAVRSLMATLCGGAVGVTMALLGYEVWSLVGQQLASAIVGGLVLWSSSDWRPGFKVSVKHFKDLFAFGINIVGVNVLNFFNRRSDDLLIGYFLGPVALGYYTVAYRILLVMTQLLTSTISSSALPVFSRLQQEPERLRNAFYKTTQMTSLIAFPAFLCMTVMAPEIVRVVFGEQWLPSIPVMQILAFIGILHSVYYFNTTIIMAMGKPNWKLKLNLLNALTNVLAFILVVRWGIIAVAASYVVRGYLLSPLPLWVIRKLIQIQFTVYLRQFLPTLAASLIMVIFTVLSKLSLENWLSQQGVLTVCISIAAFIYVVNIRIIAPKLFNQAFNLAFSAIHVKSIHKA